MYPSLSSCLHLIACEKKKQIYGMAGQLGRELCRLIPSSDSDGGSDRRCIAELVRVELCSVLHGSEVHCSINYRRVEQCKETLQSGVELSKM